MKFEVTILGSSSATPIYNRNPTSQALNVNEKVYLIDCGEGTQQQMLRFNVRASKIEFIFISHLHGDHYLGLIGLLSSLHLNGRKKTMHIFGPPDLKDIIDLNLKASWTTLHYELAFHPTQTDFPEVILDNSDLTVETIVLSHRIPCTGFVFRQKPPLQKLKAEMLEFYNVARNQFFNIKKGEDYIAEDGTIVPNEVLTEQKQHAKSYAFCSDTMAVETYLPQLANIDLLYHETTFLHELIDRANETHHTTALQAAEIALKVQAKKLIIGHFSARYKSLEPFLIEARSVFSNTDLAIEGKSFEI